MIQKVPVKQDEQHSLNALWWHPLFAWQHQLNRSLRKGLSEVTGHSPHVLDFWDLEKGMLASVQNGMQQWLGELFNNRQMAMGWFGGSHPNVDITHTEEGFVLRAELPGITAEEVNITTSGNALTIGVQKKAETASESKYYIRKECCYGSINRTVAMPPEANVEKAEASLENGVLLVRMPLRKPNVHTYESEVCTPVKIAVSARNTPSKAVPKASAR